MGTDQRPGQSTPEPGTPRQELDPHPRCTEHPRKELEFFCKAHDEVICASCVITRHFECQHSMQLEGVESAARTLREEVTADIAERAAERKEELMRAAQTVERRQLDVVNQCEALVDQVDAYFRAIVEAAEARRQELRDTLIAEKERKDAALVSQIMQLQRMAEMLEERRTGTLEAMASSDIENESVRVIMEGLRLRQELQDATRASEASEPVEDANLHVALPPIEPAARGIREVGWGGALSADPSQCVMIDSIDRPLVAGATLSIGLEVRDQRGERMAVEEGLVVAGAGAGARATVRKQEEGSLVVDVQACTLNAGECQREVEVEVKIGGTHIASSPFRLTVIDTELRTSTILTSAEYVKSVIAFVPGKAFKLLYRATRDGWRASDFHTRCDGQGATVVLVKSTSSGESIFGGYTSIPWSSTGAYRADPSSFLFSVLKSNGLPSTKLAVKGGQVGCAVNHNGQQGPTFGGGHDLYLGNMANSSSSSYSNLGHTYEAPVGVQADTFLAGARNFMPCEIEVYFVP